MCCFRCWYKKFRTEDSIKLINYIFNNFQNLQISKELINNEFEDCTKINMDQFTVNKGISKQLESKIKWFRIYFPPIRKDLLRIIWLVSIDCRNKFWSPIYSNLGN